MDFVSSDDLMGFDKQFLSDVYIYVSYHNFMMINEFRKTFNEVSDNKNTFLQFKSVSIT